MQTRFLVVVPSCGAPDTLLPTLRRMARCSEGAGAHILVALNPVDPDNAEALFGAVESVDCPDGVRLSCARVADGPCGFGAAVNRGVRVAVSDKGADSWSTLVVVNDDVAVAHGWLDGLRGALDTDTVRLWGEPGTEKGRPLRDAKGYGRIGVVGPASDNVAGVQKANLDQAQREKAATEIDQFAAMWREHNPGSVMSADFLSGFCIALDRACFEDVAEDGALFWESPIGGYEDNDLAVRLERAGWRCAVAAEVFVHHKAHQTLDRYFPGQQRGMANRLAYYDRWREVTQGPQALVGVMRVGFTFTHDLRLLQAAVQRFALLGDGLAVLLTNNPLEVTSAWDWPQMRGSLAPADQAFLKGCANAGPEVAAKNLEAWLAAVVEAVDGARFGADRITVEAWAGEPNERDERNAAILLGHGVAVEGERWLMSIDHDEVVEDRITRAHLDRWLRHPDPLVRALDVGWLNHWDSQRMVRTDPPWADGHVFATGMRGFRVWRACDVAPRVILAGTDNGLHNGNAPEFDLMAKRVAALRFRHFGYLRARDRAVKQARYEKIDPNPNQGLVGSTSYSHLTDEEGMLMSGYMPENGVGMTMLAYSGEPIENVAHWLDLLHCAMDTTVIVWTDDDAAAPDSDIAALAGLFRAELAHHPLADNLGETRNAGLRLLRKAKCAWAWVVDPDERPESAWPLGLALRRMAERADTYGWLVEFLNLRPPETGEPPTASETVRMVRLDPDGMMQYAGRVHETFDAACRALRAAGVHPNLKQAPFRMMNPGLALDDVAIERKLRRYQRLLLLELQDDPLNSGAWVSLALQYENDGKEDLAFACLLRAGATAQNGYLAHRELAMWHLRRGKRSLARARQLLPPPHRLHQATDRGVQLLDRLAPDIPLTGLARRGQVPQESVPPLPAWPAELGPDPAGPLAILGPPPAEVA